MVYFHGGNSQTVIVGSFLNITAAILTEQLVDVTTVEFVQIDGESGINPIIQTFNNLEFYISYTYVGVPSDLYHQLCFNYIDESDGSGEVVTMSAKTCTGNYTLNVIGKHINFM